MSVHLQLFAAVREMAGCQALEIELPPGAKIADLRQALVRQVPALAALAPHLMFAINAQYATEATVIPQAAEVACIPPVSGG